jgi:gliding motility-associated-like protein
LPSRVDVKNKSIRLYKFLFFLLCILIGHNSHAQLNLVPNGDFEEYYTCPSITTAFFLNSTCNYWNSPTNASPDYCNACSDDYDPILHKYRYSVPENYYGYQPAHSGVAYAALGCQQSASGDQSYMEYIQVELNQTLKKGIMYEVSFFVHNPKPDFCFNSVGALFTPSELNLETQEIISSITPQITSNPDVFFRDTVNWYEVKQFYCATGNEKFMTIGLFKRFPELKVVHYEGWVPEFPWMWGMLYIDDVSVIEKKLELANIFTPNQDGKNDKYVLDLKLIGASKAVILNRWGNVILEEETFLNWDGTDKGSDCPDGVYFIRLEFEEHSSMTEEIQLIR